MTRRLRRTARRPPVPAAGRCRGRRRRGCGCGGCGQRRRPRDQRRPGTGKRAVAAVAAQRRRGICTLGDRPAAAGAGGGQARPRQVRRAAEAACSDAAGACGSVIDAVAAGAPRPARQRWAQPSENIEVRPCMQSAARLPAFAASCLMNGRPGTPGRRVQEPAPGRPALGALSASGDRERRLRRRSCWWRSSFLVNVHGSPNPLTARLRPKLRRYWCYSSDTCGIYPTVTDVTATVTDR